MALLPAGAAEPLRLGMIGLDTSHVPAFAKVFNDPKAPGHVPGGKVVAAFKGGSPDIVASASRVEGFTKQLVETHGVKLYDSIEELARNVDAILIESVDGRTHLDQFRRTLAAKKPVFIDKPFAGSLKDAVEMVRLAREAGVPIFSSSSLRFAPEPYAPKLATIGDITSAFSIGPADIEPTHPDFFWYGIHAVETLFAAMWQNPRNLADPAVLAATLAAAGFDPALWLARAAEADVKAALVAATEDAVARGVFGAPSFFVGDAFFFGQDRLDWVEAALQG